jgi:hypothetical protein
MTTVARRSPSSLSRVRSAVRDRVIAVLSVLALLAGLGVDVRATVMVHGAAHAAASIDAQHDGARGEHRGGHHVGARDGHPDASHAGQPAGQHRDDAPAEPFASACCHAVCPATVVSSATGSCTALRLAADSSLRLLESTRVVGLQHAPPLRPPR